MTNFLVYRKRIYDGVNDVVNILSRIQNFISPLYKGNPLAVVDQIMSGAVLGDNRC
jgi:hypothetical protein